MPSKPKNSEMVHTVTLKPSWQRSARCCWECNDIHDISNSEKDLDFDMDFSNGEDQPKKGQKTETMNKDSKISELKKVTLSTKWAE